MRRITLTLLVVGAAIALLATSVVAAGNHDLWWHVVGGGGGRSSSANYAVHGTIGQPAMGASSGASYRVTGGFWQALALPTMPGATPTPTATTPVETPTVATATSTSPATATATRRLRGAPRRRPSPYQPADGHADPRRRQSNADADLWRHGDRHGHA